MDNYNKPKDKDGSKKEGMCPDQFKLRFDNAKSLREQWRSLLEDTYELFLPNRQGFTKETPGQEKTEHLFTNTGVKALNSFTNTLKDRLMPTQQRWAKLTVGGEVSAELTKGNISEEQVEELNNMLDEDTEILFDFMWASNMDVSITEALKDMAISTGAIMIQDTGDKDDPFNFVSVPADQLVIEESPRGDIKSSWREWKLKAREIPLQWSDHVQDDELMKLLKDNPEDDVCVIEGTIFNPETKVV